MEAVLTGPLGRTLLGSGELTIGCDPDNQLIVTDIRAAAHHALIHPEGSGYAIVDLGSAYGTIINGRWLDANKAQHLQPGDVVQIGNAIFTFEEFPDAASIPTFTTGNSAENAPMPTLTPPDAGGIGAGYSTSDFGSTRYAATADAPAPLSMPTPMPLIAQPRPPTPVYTPQPWIPGGSTTYPPQQRLWQQDNRRLTIALGVMLAAIIIVSLIAIAAFRSTPDKTLDTFCNALSTSDGQLAYNQLSTKYQNQQGAFFTIVVTSMKAVVCTHTPAVIKGASATATLNTTFVSNSKSTRSNPQTPSKSLVTLVQDANGVWKIDNLQTI